MASPYAGARVARHRLAPPPGDIIERMSRRSASLTLAAVLLVALVTVAFTVPMPYVVLSPGVTENTLGTYDGKPVIAISGHRTYLTSGHLDLTTVSVTSPDYQPRLPEILKAWWSRRQIVLPRDVIYPPEQTVSEVKQVNQQQMVNSQDAAIAAGLAEAGIDALSLEVSDVVAGTPADGELQKGDIITSVDGAAVESTADAVAAISDRAPGDTVTLGIVRAGQFRDVELATEPSPDDSQTARIGISLGEVVDPPFDVSIRLGQDIGGPSAGLMFSLAIYDLITPGELTGGRFVAGTGTIDPAGNVGLIGGIQQKIAGAYENRATVFLVPSGDCAEASQSDLANDVKLVKVSTIHQAVDALEALKAGDEGAVPQC